MVDNEAVFRDLQRLRDESLDPELDPYVEEGPLGRMLRHPLVYEVPLVLPGSANRLLRQKRDRLAEAVKDADWSTAVWLHERPHRLDAFIEYVLGADEDGQPIPLGSVTDDAVRALAADVWVDSENIEQNLDEWGAIFASPHGILFNDDPQGWAALPDPLIVFRAGIDDGGWSWTLDRKVAEFFAHRWGANHPLVTAKISKADVFGYLTRRSESEVLAREGSAFDVTPIE